MADRYRLPEALGGGECEIVERDPALTLMGRPAHVVHALRGETHSAYAVVQSAELTKVEPPLPPEPPDGAVVVDRTGTAWVHGVRDDRAHDRIDWFSTDNTEASWATLNHSDFAPLTRLVPDPAAGVELPWRDAFTSVLSGGPASPIVDTNEHDDRAISVALSPAGARAKAAALLAAADAAEAGPR